MKRVMARGWLVVLLGVGACAALSGVQQGASGIKDQAGGLKDQAEQIKGKTEKKDDDAEGEDDDRLKAKEAKINEAINDKIHGKKDKVDWRKFSLTGHAGILKVELFWDTESANLDVDVFDENGVNIGKSPPRLEGQQSKRVLVQVDKPAVCYVRIQTIKKKDVSIYTLRVNWGGGQILAEPAQPAPGPTPTPTPIPVPSPGGVPGQPVPDPNKVFGSIVSAYREGSQWVLYLDKGSAAKLRQGMQGSILEGTDGEKPVEGGTFTISQVNGESKSVARSSMSKPIGKNKRFLVLLK